MLATIQSWLTAHLDLARVAVAIVVFLVIYLVRKLAPSLWLRFEALSPALSLESEWLSEQLHKLFQALPSALLGAVVAPLMLGGDWRQAALGALNGLAAPLSHELLSRYEGKLGKVKPKGPTGGDFDDTVSLMPDPVKLVAQDRSRLHNDIPDDSAFSGLRRAAWGTALALTLLGCGSHISWPKVAACADQLEQPLLQTVASVLAGTGDVKTELEQVAVDHGAGVVECAVQQLVDDMAGGPTTARASRAAARGRAFLTSVQR